MKNDPSRREFLKTAGLLTAGVALGGLSGSPSLGGKLADGAPFAEKLGWRLGCQAYSFHHFTFVEAVEKTASLGLHYIEAYPGQKFSPQSRGFSVVEDMSAAQRKEALQRVADAGLKLVNFGVCGLSREQDACRKKFEFAKEMGIETLIAEPEPAALDVIEKLCDEYQINVGIHNHPKPARYWHYDTVLEACKGRTKRMGACADVGHWLRSYLNPVEAVKKLEGRIISFHFKDRNQPGEDPGDKVAHDVPWGTGKVNIEGVLTEVYRQRLKAVFSAEYEYNWLNSLPEIAQSVKYFEQVAAKLYAQSLLAPGEKAS